MSINIQFVIYVRYYDKRNTDNNLYVIIVLLHAKINTNDRCLIL